MDEKELKTLMESIAQKNGDAIKQAVKNEIESALAGVVKADELKQVLQKMDLTDGEIKKLLGAIDKQGSELRKVFDARPGPQKTIEQIVAEKSEAIKALSTGGANVKFNINKTLVTRASYANSTLGYRLPDMGELAYPPTVLESLFRHANVGPGSNGVIRYFDQAAVTRGANWVAEAAQKPESAISWIERLLPIEKVADSIPVTKEAWNDIPYIQSELRRLLEVNIALRVDDGLYDGTGVTPIIKGVWTSAPAFVTTPYADTVEAANIYDLILTVAADISAAGKYSPNVALVNPINAVGAQTAKTSQGNYIVPPFVNGGSVGGIRVVPSAQVAPNTMVVGDFNYGTIYELEDLTIEMGWVNDQFIKNCFTILAERRLALLIRTVDEPAFRKVASISAALGDLETPAA